MKGLHAIAVPAATMTWRWYAAHNTRNGRRHLLKVPVVAIDLLALLDTDRRRIPYNLRYSNAEARIEWANRMMREHRNLVIPYNCKYEPSEMDSPQDYVNSAQRYCDTEQRAMYYELQATPTTHHVSSEPPRGFCHTCWRFWHQEGSPARNACIETQWTTAMGYLNLHQSRWEDMARRDYRPR